MIPLDSPRWRELRHAYGSAEDIPGLLRALAADENLDDTWDELWSSLCHQYSVYSATFAAIPHLVAIAEVSDTNKKLQIQRLIGVVCAKGNLEHELPDDILQTSNAAIRRMAQISSAMLAHDFARIRSDEKPIHYWLEAHLALWLGKHPLINEIDYLDCWNYETHIECPECSEEIEISPKEIASAGVIDVQSRDRSLEHGLRLIKEVPEEEWTTESVVEIAAALATKFGDDELATTILNFRAELICPACRFQFQILKAMILEELTTS